MNLSNLRCELFSNSDQETDRFLKAKEYVFKRDWQKARGRLEYYLQTYPSGQFRDEALYWLAQSLNKLSREEQNLNLVLSKKEQAMQKLNLIIKEYPKSLWLDDAQELKIEISGELFLIGKKEHQKYIKEIIETKIKNEIDLKMKALNTLIDLKPVVAIKVLENVIKTDKDPSIRKQALFILGCNFSDKALNILNAVAEKDPDESVKKEASLWIKRNEMDKIPVHLNSYAYSARIKDKKLIQDIPENKLISYPLTGVKPKNNKSLEKTIKRVFDNEISKLKMESASFGELNIRQAFNVNFVLSRIMHVFPDTLKRLYSFKTADVTHRLNDFELEVIDKGYDQISGNVSYYDQKLKKELVASFLVNEDQDQLLAIRKGEELAILALQFESDEKEIKFSKEPIYSTRFTDVLGCKVHSARQSWNLDEMMVTKNSVTDFGQAKAEIPGERGRWRLIARNILFNRKERKFIGRKADLYDPKGKCVAKANEIVVSVDEPEKYEVIK